MYFIVLVFLLKIMKSINSNVNIFINIDCIISDNLNIKDKNENISLDEELLC